MTKRRTLIVGLVSMAVLAGVAVAAAYVFRDPVNASACEQIKKGMTEAEVVAILGRPCDGSCNFLRVSEKSWLGSAGIVTVELGESGTVQDVWYFKTDNTIWQKIRAALWREDDPSSAYPKQTYK